MARGVEQKRENTDDDSRLRVNQMDIVITLKLSSGIRSASSHLLRNIYPFGCVFVSLVYWDTRLVTAHLDTEPTRWARPTAAGAALPS